MTTDLPGLGRKLFLALVAMNALLFAWLIAGDRIVRGHDTWQFYSTQYAFLSNAAQGGGVPYWMPLMSHGTATPWHQFWQGGLVQNVLLGLGPLLRGANFLPLFTLALFLDELLFLVGVWMLSRRLYASPATAFFVTSAAVGSCLWADQIWYNFRAFYAVPLILCWLHDFVDSGSRLKLFLAADLFLLQAFGNLPYLPVLTGLALLFYAGAMIATAPRRPERLARLRPVARDLLWIPPLLASAALVYLSLRSGTELNVVQTAQRRADGTTSLDDFVVYGGYTNPIRYLELLHGIPVSLDYTLYCSFFTPAFAALALLRSPRRRTLVVSIVVVLSVLFSCGALSLIAPSLYHLLPGMRYFRHVALVAPFVKLFLIFLSGFGFERASAAFQADPRTPARLGAAWIGFGLLLGLLGFSGHAALRGVVGILRSGMIATYGSPDLESDAFVARALLIAAAGATATGAAFLLARRMKPAAAIWMILGVHAVQLFAWKADLLRIKTLPLTPEQAALQRLEPMPYVARRSEDYSANRRFAALDRDILEQEGNSYWTTDAYLFIDPPASRYRTTDWMRPFDQLLRAYSGQAIDDRSVPPAAWAGYRLTFPLRHPAAARVIGLSVDKLQVFSDAHVLKAEDVARRLTDPAYRGDLLFLEGPDSTPVPPLDGNERVDVRPTVLEFDANHLRLSARVPRQAWLLYCDVWHPGWTAEVNGRAVPVSKAQLAYKAVPLEPGENLVELRFRAPVRAACFAATSLHSFLWIVLIVVLAVRLALPEKASKPRGT